MENFIRINKFGFIGDAIITSKHKLFSNDYVDVEVYADYIRIASTGLEYDPRYKKVTHRKDKVNSFGIRDESIPEGKFYIDTEDSNEDEIYINLI